MPARYEGAITRLLPGGRTYPHVSISIVDLLVILISVLSGLLTDLFIALVFSRRRARARRSRASGLLVLEYGRLLKAFPVGIAAFFTFMTFYMAMTVTIRTDADLLYAILFVVFWTALTAVFAAEAFGVAFEMDARGIRKRSPWSRGFYASWDEVKYVHFDARWEWYVVETLKGRMRLSLLLNGLDDFRSYAREHLPPALLR